MSDNLSVKSFYSCLSQSEQNSFPPKEVCVTLVPSRVGFCCLEMVWERVLTSVQLIKRGLIISHLVFFFKEDLELANCILIHCTVAHSLWP